MRVVSNDLVIAMDGVVSVWLGAISDVGPGDVTIGELVVNTEVSLASSYKDVIIVSIIDDEVDFCVSAVTVVGVSNDIAAVVDVDASKDIVISKLVLNAVVLSIELEGINIEVDTARTD